MKFACGVLVKNVTTNEDGRVIETYQENDAVMYMVSVPVNGATWLFGARVAYWPENQLESSENESLDQGQCA